MNSQKKDTQMKYNKCIVFASFCGEPSGKISLSKRSYPVMLWVPQEEDSEAAFPQINPMEEKKQDGVMQEGHGSFSNPLEFKGNPIFMIKSK